MSFKGHSLLTFDGHSREELEFLLDMAAAYKGKRRSGLILDAFHGKNVLVFSDKSGTKMNCIVNLALRELGIGCTDANTDSGNLYNDGSVEDMAYVVRRLFDGIFCCGVDVEIMNRFSTASGVPVWNGGSNEDNPIQSLADILTIKENVKTLRGIKIVCMGNTKEPTFISLMTLCAKLGMNFVVCAPENYFPSAAVIAKCEEFAEESGGSIALTDSIISAVRDADVVYANRWINSDEPEDEWEEKILELSAYKVTMEIMKFAKNSTIFLHPLPAEHDLNSEMGRLLLEKHGSPEVEVSDDVFDSRQSRVFDEAENLLHVTKAVVAASLGAV